MGEASKLVEALFQTAKRFRHEPDRHDEAWVKEEFDESIAPIREALETGLTMYELGEQIADAQFGDHRVLKRLERLRGKNRKIIKEALSLLSPATAETEKR